MTLERSAGVPRQRYPCPLPSSRAKEQPVCEEGGRADVCRFLAVSLLIVKMSGSCASGVRVIQDGLALSLSQPNLNIHKLTDRKSVV